MNKKTSFIVLPIIIFLILLFTTSALATGGGTYVIPIKGDINEGNLHFIERSYVEAVTAGADAIIFEVDTYGGYVDAAIYIKDIIFNSDIPTYCFVTSKAISAGSLIALAGEQLVMQPSSTIGAAEPQVNGETADEKTVSMWAAQLTSVAEARGKDGQIAAAFADSDIEIKGIVDKGKLLTLSADQALEYGIADKIVDSRSELISAYRLNSNVVEVNKTFKDNLISWLSSPFIAAILLTIGIAGIVIEILTVGSFGIFGGVGVAAFVLYFIGHFWAGNLGAGTVILFVVGLILLAAEIFVIPGFGVAGILGILSLFTSIVLASPSIEYAITSILIALAASTAIIIFTLKNKQTRKIWGRLVLSQKQENKDGFVAPDVSLTGYLGVRGRAISLLRPAGVVEINGKRIDVVTSGEFIEAGSIVEVVLIEGLRVVVKKV